MEKVDNIILSDNKRYSGYGIFQNGEFIPQGYGKKYYSDMYASGNFINGKLNGPAIISHNYYMHTMQMKNNRGNGWGLCINGGELIEFGYFENSQLKSDLLDAVEWYYEKMKNSGRSDENMLHTYTSKIDNTVTDLHIGYTGKSLGNGIATVYMGFHFLSDGTVWIGNSGIRQMTGDLIKFCPNGYIEIGKFENGILVEPKDIQELIDNYYGTHKFPDDDPFYSLFMKSREKTERELRQERIRAQYNNIHIDTSKNYFK